VALLNLGAETRTFNVLGIAYVLPDLGKSLEAYATRYRRTPQDPFLFRGGWLRLGCDGLAGLSPTVQVILTTNERTEIP
jgi:hypothetical protein